MKLIRVALFGGIAIAIAVSCLVGFLIEPRDTVPLVSGPPEFIILAIIVALAAFLRQVGVQATELRDKIVVGDVWNYPPDSGYAKKKIAVAEKTCEAIRVVSPFMILMIVAVCGRIAWDAVVRLLYTQEANPPALYAADIALILYLCLILLGISIAHFLTAGEDAAIRAEARTAEKVNLARHRCKMDVVKQDPAPPSRPPEVAES
jgi:hypothetical protein